MRASARTGGATPMAIISILVILILLVILLRLIA
jgi:hypothetical protein